MLDISIWLIPQKKQKKDLQEIIDNLSLKYHTSTFIPHITIYYLGQSAKLNEVVPFIKQVAENTKPFELEIENILYSEQFTKTLYIQYKINPALQILYEKFRKKFYSINPYELNPHLSLIYKTNMKKEDKVGEIKKFKIPNNLILDRLMVITKKGSNIKLEKDVLDWEVALESPLQ